MCIFTEYRSLDFKKIKFLVIKLQRANNEKGLSVVRLIR